MTKGNWKLKLKVKDTNHLNERGLNKKRLWNIGNSKLLYKLIHYSNYTESVWIWSWCRAGHEMTTVSVQTRYSLHHIIPFLLNIPLVSPGNQVLLFKWFGSDCVLQVLPFQRRRFTGNSSIFLTNSCIKTPRGYPSLSWNRN